MWSRIKARQRQANSGLEELRAQRRKKEAELRKERREQQLTSRRLVRESLEETGGHVLAKEYLTQQQVAQLLEAAQHGPEKMKSLSRLRRSLQQIEGQQTFIRVYGSMRTLIGLFTSSLAEVQLEAARCLHELSQSADPSVSEACTPATCYLLTYLSGHSVEFTELCLYTVGNLVVENEDLRMKLMAQGVIPAFLFCIQSPHAPVVEALGYALSQLLQATEAPQKIIPLVFESGLIQHMLRLVQPTSELGVGVAVEFAWCLHYIVCSQVNNALLLSQGLLQILMKLLVELSTSISREAVEGLELLLRLQLVCPVVRCLGNLLAETEAAEGRAQLRDGRLLVALFVLMKYFLEDHQFVVRESLWLLNNMTADDPVFCSAILHWDLVPALLELLPVSKELNLLGLTILCNIAEKGPAYCQQLRRMNVLLLLMTLLRMSDLEVVHQSLEFLHLLFLHCPEAAEDFVNQSGLQTLEQYQDTLELQKQLRVITEQCVGTASNTRNATQELEPEHSMD